MGRLLMWIEYLPRGFRSAWCELTGGHDSRLLTARKGRAVSHVMLQCGRCGLKTRWYATAYEHLGM